MIRFPSNLRQFLRRLLFFLLPLACLAVLAECLVRTLPNSYCTKDLWMDCHAQTLELLILGNSHAYYGLRPKLVEEVRGMAPHSVVNLANVSQSLKYDRLLLEQYAPRCPQLRTVVLLMDNSNLFDPPLEESDEAFRCAYYEHYMGIHDESAPLVSLEIWDASSFRAKWWKFLTGGDADCDSVGWGLGYTLASRDQYWDNEGMLTVVANHRCRNWTWARKNRKEVTAIARYCHDHHLQLLLLSTPVWPAYWSLIGKDQKQLILDVVRECTTLYGAQYADYVSDPRFCSDDFRDVDHLSDVGATKFSRLFAASLGSDDY